MSSQLNENVFHPLTLATSAVIDNSAALDFRDDLELYITFLGPPRLFSPGVELYIIPVLDNAAGGAENYSPEDPRVYGGTFLVNRVSGAQRIFLPEIPIPPGPFIYVLRNNTGVSSWGTQNTLRRRSHHRRGKHLDDVLYLYP